MQSGILSLHYIVTSIRFLSIGNACLLQIIIVGQCQLTNSPRTGWLSIASSLNYLYNCDATYFDSHL